MITCKANYDGNKNGTVVQRPRFLLNIIDKMD